MAVSDKSVAVCSTIGFSSVSTVSDDWQELTKSDYAKVIFSDLLCDAASRTVECKFQITDNVHEDPNDYVGLFRIGYEDLSQCFVSKMLSQTKCEDDGKLQRCVFTSNELPTLDDGFYQFLYVTRDQEICGASMPFLVKLSTFQKEKNSVDKSSSENMDGDFLLVSNEMERKDEESIKHEKAPAQQNTLTDQKKEEIAAWVSQNPDYSLIEQIKDYMCTIDVLQQSKDLTVREIIQLYDILNSKNGELDELNNMLAAYEEKIKMSQCLTDEKNAEIAELRKSLTYSDEKLKLCVLHQNKRDEELAQVKNEFLLQSKKLKESLVIQDQQKIEISNLKLELEEMKEIHKAKKCQQEAAEIEHSMETVIQKAQDMVQIVSAAMNKLDFSNEYEVEKFFQLKIVFLIILSKIARATDLANTCDQNGLHKTIYSIIPKDAKENRSDIPSSSNVGSQSLSDLREKESAKLNIPSSSNVESQPLSDLREKEPANEDASEKIVQRMSLNKSFESETLEHSIIELPRLEFISDSMTITLMADEPLDSEDVAVINRLTEKIIKKRSNLHEVIEVADDSSDSASDASEISECSLSIKRDLLCVGRMMEALSCLSDQKNLEKLIVVENEEDKNLIHRNEWIVLLQKCALHYQIELLLEHIEKQKEGIKKVSEKICDLLTECMILKDEVSHSSAVHKKLHNVIAKKDVLLSKLKGELEFKNRILSHFCSQKLELEHRAQLADKTIDDLHARIMEGSTLYKQQYTEILRLSKKLCKYQSAQLKTKSSKRESSVPSSETLDYTSSFEVVKNHSVQNINDSDTGEHMFEKGSLISNEETEACVDSNTDFKKVPECASSPLTSSLNNPEAPIVAQKAKVQDLFAKLSSINAECTNSQNELENCLTKHGLVEEKSKLTETNDEKLNDALNSGTRKSEDLHCSIKISPKEDLAQHEKMIASIEGNKIQNRKTASGPSSFEDLLSSADEVPSLFSDFASYEQFQEAIKEIFANIKNPPTLRNTQECSIACYVCKKAFPLHPEAPLTDLMDHLESEHSMKMCPVCGHLFDDAIPPKYFHIHVEQHFETERT